MQCQEWLNKIAKEEPRLRLLANDQQLGIYGSYQLLFSKSSSNYFVQLDADDKLDPLALGKAIALLDKSPESPFLYSQCWLMEPNGSKYALDQRALRPWRQNNDLVQFIPFHMRMIRRSAYLKVGGYLSSSFVGDYDLRLRLSELGPPIYLPEPLYSYRVHRNSASQTKRRYQHSQTVNAARNAIKRRGMAPTYNLIHSPYSGIITLTNVHDGPWVIAGMHRSGTSLLARMLSKLGIIMGKFLIPKDAENPEGYEEDANFVQLHREWFHSSLIDSSYGFADWGWTPERCIDGSEKAYWREKALKLLAERESDAKNQQWGWKDPRTTLLLPFWHQLKPNMRTIGIYRSPWDLSDALQRRQNSLLRMQPEMILSLWSLYNERLVTHIEKLSTECILLNAQSLKKHTNKLVELLIERWDWKPDHQTIQADLNELVEPNRMPSIPLGDPIEDLYRLVFPELMKIWDRLQTIADLPALSENNTNIAAEKKNKQTNKKPDISVIIPTFNPCHFLLEAIASVKRYKSEDSEVEVIIVDDGSTKSSSRQILQRLKQGGYRILRIEHSGLAAARNHGINAANAELIIPLDDDNRLLSPYLQDCLSIIRQNPDMEMIFGDRLDFGARTQHFKPGILNAKQLVKANRIDACTLMKRSLWKKCGGFDENLKALEDWDLWLTGMQIGMRAIYHPKPCFEYRVRENSMLQCHLANENEHHKTIHYLRAKHGLPIEALIQ